MIAFLKTIKNRFSGSDFLVFLKKKQKTQNVLSLPLFNMGDILFMTGFDFNKPYGLVKPFKNEHPRNRISRGY